MLSPTKTAVTSGERNFVERLGFCSVRVVLLRVLRRTRIASRIYEYNFGFAEFLTKKKLTPLLMRFVRDFIQCYPYFILPGIVWEPE